MIRTLTPGPVVVEAALSSRGLPLRFLPHKSAAVMGLPGRRLSQHEITAYTSGYAWCTNAIVVWFA